MIHPAVELRFINDTIGFGVFATRLIPRGTITWVLDPLDQIISGQSYADLAQVQQQSLEKYIFGRAGGDYILCWDLARYVNHCCQACCRHFEAFFDVARRDIEPGSEITSDYGELQIAEMFACLCRSAHCRGQVGPADALVWGDEWQRERVELLQLVPQVEQPLLPLARALPDLSALLDRVSSVTAAYLKPGR